jgi:hypothetical protein
MTDTEKAISQMERCYAGCAAMNSDNREFVDFVIAAFRAQQERENPKPLSLGELKEKKKGWVWIVDNCKDMPYSGWAIARNDIIMYLWDSEFAPVGLARKDLSDKYYTKNYGRTWLAYDHEPKEDKP